MIALIRKLARRVLFGREQSSKALARIRYAKHEQLARELNMPNPLRAA